MEDRQRSFDVRSAKGMEFAQGMHNRTMHDLHAEVERLQMKCSGR